MRTFDDTVTEERAVPALSRVVHKFLRNGQIGAWVLDRYGRKQWCKLAEEPEDEIRDAMVLLAANGRFAE